MTLFWIIGHAVGSSPRVRGLLYDDDYGRYFCRIIPARAGFTAMTCPEEPEASDHPRACGVYVG